MKIYASGEAQSAYESGNFITAEMERVVGIIDLGANNCENKYGWCGLKAVLIKDNKPYVLDFPEDVRIETADGIPIIEGEKAWHPSLSDRSEYDLFFYDKRMFE